MEQSKTDAHDQPESSIAGKSYSDVGKQITNWTSNLLATAVVLIIALVCGTQLISLWKPDSLEASENTPGLADAWPVLASCSLEFGEAPFRIQRESVIGSRAEALAQLQKQCKQAIQENAPAFGTLGLEEAEMIKSSSHLEPLEQAEGEWRIVSVDQSVAETQTPLVLGIKDNCPGKNSESTSRMVVWGLALSMGQEKPDDSTNSQQDGQSRQPAKSNDAEDPHRIHRWTTFVGTVVSDEERAQLKSNLLPDDAKRTMTISNANRGSLTGFTGGRADEAMEFYDRLAAEHEWIVHTPWQQQGDSWSASYDVPRETSIQGIQVQMIVNHNEIVRGMMMVQTK